MMIMRQHWDWAEQEEIDTIRTYAKKVNEFLKGYFLDAGNEID